ncbi:MAG: amino acid ABC transporter permease [Deltaproteobacteria bacterium]|nr:amino acid ABC transporter permease [Deltaproteobacteria bacterium]MBI3077433.1 amino acid ABC transporter permease [Deltaproteobacteria bacterium]
MYSWNFQVLWEFRIVFFNGAIITLELTLLSMSLALGLGLLVGIARLAKYRAVSGPAAAYVEFLRDTPLLVQIIWVFYCFPILTGIKLSAFWASALAISVHMSAYVAEVFRAGIASIERGQTESAKVLGMSYSQIMQRIILPQAVRRMLPPFVNQFADILKLTSLASVLAVGELLHATNNLIINTFRPLELYTFLALAYFVLIYPVAFGARRAEVYLARRI